MIKDLLDDALRKTLSAEELKVLLGISQSLHQSFDVDDLLSFIISSAKKLLGVETVSILLHDPAKDELFFRLTEGNPEDGALKLKEIRFPAHEGIAGRVFGSGKAEWIPDVSLDPSHYKIVDEETSFRTKSLMAAPLQVRGHAIGVIEICNKREGEFSARDLSLLCMIADTVATAINNARLHSELERAYQDLQVLAKAKDHLIERTQEENLRLRREIESRYRFDLIKGNSPQMLELFRLCERVIHSDITVLIEGETGTGKELIARCLHFNGTRKERSFVAQNCGGIPESLLASELFGHKKGAFTGAVSDKKGLFEMAHGGTVFLDEVGEMSATMQVSLLRVLQEGEIRPLGSNEIKKVDVRVISATNRSLRQEVESGTFREDLFYRLSVFVLQVPPLRERNGDIPILANHFVRKFNKKMNRTVRGLSSNSLEALRAHAFPGNVRELENEIERAMVLAEDGEFIDIVHLSKRVSQSSLSNENLPSIGGKLKDQVEGLERKLLLKALQEYDGNRTRMADQLGLSRFGLMKKMKRYGLS